jgi:hypothetical protein
MNSGRYVRHTENLQQFTDRSVEFDKDRRLFRTFANPAEVPYEGAETTLQLALLEVH